MKEQLIKNLHQQIAQADLRLLKMLYSTAKIYQSEENLVNEKQLFRMVYSSARDPFCTIDDIKEILLVSRRNNKPLGVTGLLLHTDMRFLQILEGTQGQIKTLYDKIEKDSRHSDSKTLYFEAVSERYFSDWHMGSKNIENQQLEFDTEISGEENKLYQAMLSGDRRPYDDKSMKALKTFMILT